MMVKRVVLREAADFAGANTQTAAVSVKGARQVVFLCTATNAQTLSVGMIQVSGDGTNWSNTGNSSASAKVGVNTELANGVAMNAGPVRAIGVPGVATVSQQPPYILDEFARFNYTAVSAVTGLKIVAEVYYDHGGAASVIGDTNMGITN